MDAFLDLADPTSLWEHKAELQHVFGLTLTDPNSMPVTRDLSPAKRAAIETWLSAPEPVLGEPTPAPELSATPAAVAPAALASAARIAAGGGKLAAANRRLGKSPPRR
jgi:hypothetical protein